MDVQICVTLSDWEHICERFEGATHYAEKALYKVLSQHVVPAIIADLRVSRTLSKLRPRFEQNKTGGTTEATVGGSCFATETLLTSRY